MPTDTECEGPICADDPYPLIPAGEYEAFCRSSSRYRDPRFRNAWKCRLDFEIVTGGRQIKLCGFLHLGTENKPKAGRSSEYRRAWIIANAEQPKRRQVMSHFQFRGKSFRVMVSDTVKRYDGSDHPPAQFYSTVKRILSRTGP